MLLISCSNRKNQSTATPKPAFELYDGVFYRLIKNTFRNNQSIQNKLDIFILSAKYHVIPSDSMIEPYNLKMDKKISISNKQINTSLLKRYILEKKPRTLTVVMGKTYRDSIDWNEINIPITFITGEIGMMQSQLKKWLLSL